jgi:hypothetical protein
MVMIQIYEKSVNVPMSVWRLAGNYHIGVILSPQAGKFKQLGVVFPSFTVL